jgi:hypothetical protein
MKNDRPKAKRHDKIPPPPGLEAGFDEIIAYHSRYTLDELEKAGYVEDASPEHVQEVAAAAEYWFLCRDGLHVKLTRKEYERLSKLVAREHVTAQDLVKRWIRERLAKESQRLVGDKR